MTKLRYAPEVVLDVERITLHLRAHEVEGIEQRIADIFGALDILLAHPLIGRPVQQGRRELVIGREARGYVARYRYEELDDTVVVLALRSQREAGFRDA